MVARLSERFSVAGPFVPPKVEPAIKRETLLQNSKPDLVFLINGQKIYAHTYILSRKSKVFNVMMMGSVGNEKIIEIKDASKDIFELILKAMYEGSEIFTMEGVLECLDCFMISHKYNIQELELDLLNSFLRRPQQIMFLRFS